MVIKLLRKLFIYFIVCLCFYSHATDYYSASILGAGTDVTDPNNWSSVYQDLPTAWGGSGNSPVDFTNPSDHFYIVDGDAMDATGIWTVAGNVTVTSNSIFDASGFNHAMTINLETASYYFANSAYTSLVFGTIATDADFYFSSSTASHLRYDLSYPNLHLEPTVNIAAFTGNLTVLGNLIINTSKIISFVSSASRDINITGSLQLDAGTVNISNGAAGANVNIGGDFILNGGTMKAATGNGSSMINVTGSYIQNLGTFQGVQLTTNGNPTFNIGGDFTYSGGTYNARVNGTGAGTGRVTFVMSGSSKTITATNMANSDHKFTLNSSISLGSDFSISNVFTNNGSLTINNHTLNLAGTVSGTGTMTGGSTSNLTYSGTTSSANLPAIILNTLTVNRTGQIITMTGNVQATSVVLTAGTLSIGANTLTLSGDISGSGTLTGGTTSNISVSSLAAASLTLPSVTLNNLTLNRTLGIVLGGNVTVNGVLTLTAGPIDNISNSLTLGNGATIIRNSGLLQAPPTFGTSLNITYTGNGNLSVDYEMPTATSVLNNLTCSKTGTVTLINPITVNGNLTISSGTLNTDASNNFAITSNGNWINNGTFTANSGTVTFGGTTAISGSGTHNFSSITLSGSLTAPSSLNISGTFTNNGTFTHNSGSVTFNGSSSGNLDGTQKTTFYTVNFSKSSGGVTIIGDSVKIANLANITSGSLTTNGKLVLNAASSGAYASLIDASTTLPNGSVTGNIVVHKLIDARGGTATNGNAGMYSSPFSNGIVSTFQSDTKNFFFLDASSVTWTKASSTAQSLPQAVGFSRRSAKTGESNYLIGAPGNGSISPTLVTSAAGTWNLVGNPYPSSISWGSVTRSNLGGSNAAYLFNGNSWNAITSGNISLAQGFEVLALTGANLQFTNTARSSTATSFVRLANPEQKLSLHIKSSNGLRDESFIYLNSDANRNYNPKYDLPKLFPSNLSMAGLALLKENQKSVIYAINEKESSLEIPLYIKIPQNGTYGLSITETNNLSEYYRIYLKDSKSNSVRLIGADISDENLTLETSDSLRFSIVLSAGVVTNTSDIGVVNSQEIICWVKEKTLHFENISSDNIQKLEILNSNGIKVFESNLQNTINLESLPNSVYIVKMKTDKSLFTQKIVLE